MHVAIIGAAGMLGRKLTARLAVDGRLGSADLDHLTLLDVVEPDPPAGWTGMLDRARVDLADPAGAASAVAGRPDVLIHLAAVVSGEAEAEFDKGYRVRTRDKALALALTRRAARTFRRFVTEGPGVARRYREDLDRLTSRANWARLYDVDE